MKSYEQRTENINKKAQSIRIRRRAWLSVAASVCCVAIVCGVLLVPWRGTDQSSKEPPLANGTEPNIGAYEDLTDKIYAYNASAAQTDPNTPGETPGGDIDHSGTAPGAPGGTENPTQPGTNSDWVVITSLGEIIPLSPLFVPNANTGASVGAPTTNPPQGGDSSVEAPGQVRGVAEGDVLKRTQQYAFHLVQIREYSGTQFSRTRYQLNVYSLLGENSAMVGELHITAQDGFLFAQAGTYLQYAGGNFDMYLSQDATRATVVADCAKTDGTHYTCLISLDISSPQSITELTRTYVAGTYLSSRKVDGEILLVTDFNLPKNPDYDNLATIVPSFGPADNVQLFDVEEIYCPEEVSAGRYTIAAKVAEEGLEITSKLAVLSYAEQVAVSQNYIFITRTVPEEESGIQDYLPGTSSATNLRTTEVVCVDYRNKLQNVGCVSLSGVLNDRYCLDEQDGILRAVTYQELSIYKKIVTDVASRECQYLYLRSAESINLFCVDIATGNVVGKVENFAASGDVLRAVRFDGDKVYVCTSNQNADPVIVFDMSDLSQITRKDSGTIPGYSVNLVRFGDNLLGIGYGDTNKTLKIEMYSQSGNFVQIIDTYMLEKCIISVDYKTHFVDEEHQLVGLPLRELGSGFLQSYLLLHFDGTEFQKVLLQGVPGDLNLTRAFYQDGLYVFTNDFEDLHFYAV